MSQKHFHFNRYLFVFWGCVFSLVVSNFTFADEPLKIGESFNNEATGYNNSRKIARTSTDRRIVVFQNKLENRPVVQWVYSDDGINWSPPAILGYGTFPCLTIAENDWVYAVWCSENGEGICLTYLKDNTTNWEGGSLPITLVPAGAIYCKYPAIETTLNSLHVVWQGKRDTDNTDNIFYQQFARDLSRINPVAILSADSCDSKKGLLPMTCNLKRTGCMFCGLIFL